MTDDDLATFRALRTTLRATAVAITAGTTLSSDDLLHYQKIVVALTHTLRLMEEIDDLIPAWPLV